MSFAEFIAMGGYGNYVWSAYGVASVVLALNFGFAIRRLRRAKKDIDELSDPATTNPADADYP